MIFYSNISLKIPTFKITPSSEKMNSIRKKLFELSHHLGNVRSLIADVKLNESLAGGGMEQRAEIVMSSDYYPFGMTIGETHVESEGYRYGFNGMEQDDEIAGEGNSYDFGARMYDARIGRWLKLDPLAHEFVYYSPYLFAGNKPISHIDYAGNHEFLIIYNQANATATMIVVKRTNEASNSVYRAVIDVMGNFSWLDKNGSPATNPVIAPFSPAEQNAYDSQPVGVEWGINGPKGVDNNADRLANGGQSQNQFVDKNNHKHKVNERTFDWTDDVLGGPPGLGRVQTNISRRQTFTAQSPVAPPGPTTAAGLGGTVFRSINNSIISLTPAGSEVLNVDVTIYYEPGNNILRDLRDMVNKGFEDSNVNIKWVQNDGTFINSTNQHVVIITTVTVQDSDDYTETTP